MTTTIHNHSFKPEPIFHGSKEYDPKKLYLGVELEVENRDYTESADRLKYAISKFVGHENDIYLKYDGSLSNGLEVVSHPRTMSSHKYYAWKNILQALNLAGGVSHDSSRCGLHVHVNKSYLTSRQQTKLAFWIYSQVDLMNVISRRKANVYCKALNPRSIHASQVNEPDRYYKVNKKNRFTIEIRQFKGTLNYDSFMAAIEFVAASVNFIIACPVHYLANRNQALKCFLGYLSGSGLVAKKYVHLIAYLRKHGYNISTERVVWYKLNQVDSTIVI